LTEKLQR